MGVIELSVLGLLAFLVLHQRAPREQVTAALWPDADPEGGRRNLRATLNRLVSVLEPGRGPGDAPYFFRSTGTQLWLVVDDALTIDIDEFDRLVDEGDRLETAGAPSLSIEPYLAALARYRGDLLPNLYDDWVLVLRDRVRTRYVTCGVRCAKLLVATDRAREAIDTITAVLATEPWSVPAHRAMTTCEAVLNDLGGPVTTKP